MGVELLGRQEISPISPADPSLVVRQRVTAPKAPSESLWHEERSFPSSLSILRLLSLSDLSPLLLDPTCPTPNRLQIFPPLHLIHTPLGRCYPHPHPGSLLHTHTCSGARGFHCLAPLTLMLLFRLPLLSRVAMHPSCTFTVCTPDLNCLKMPPSFTPIIHIIHIIPIMPTPLKSP